MLRKDIYHRWVFNNTPMVAKFNTHLGLSMGVVFIIPIRARDAGRVLAKL
ncbi:MAG: hypothetical protein ISR65_20515 [Bacteriovoracaceae bacterium]|nr:hypothetical protein [Bacteriovoracaceae bacterium]